MKGFTIILMLALVIAALAGPAAAQSTEEYGNRANYTGKFYGVVESMPQNGYAGLWIINGKNVMVDENTVIMGIGVNRSFRNLQRNPKAVFIVMEPGKAVEDWKGVKVYLEAVDMETKGQFYEEIKHNIAKVAGQQAAEMIHAAIRFKITEIRPLVDMG